MGTDKVDGNVEVQTSDQQAPSTADPWTQQQVNDEKKANEALRNGQDEQAEASNLNVEDDAGPAALTIEEGMDGGGVAGVAVGSVFFLVGIGAAGWWLYTNGKLPGKKKPADAQQPM